MLLAVSKLRKEPSDLSLTFYSELRSVTAWLSYVPHNIAFQL